MDAYIKKYTAIFLIQTFGLFLGFSFGKLSLGASVSVSAIITSGAKDTSLIHVCFTPVSEILSIFSN